MNEQKYSYTANGETVNITMTFNTPSRAALKNYAETIKRILRKYDKEEA